MWPGEAGPCAVTFLFRDASLSALLYPRARATDEFWRPSMNSSVHTESADASAQRFAGFEPDTCFVAHWHRRTRSGYSTHYTKESSRTVNGHRLAFMLLVGSPLGAEMVLHRCGNAACLNLHHLYLGSDGENLRDRLLHKAVYSAPRVPDKDASDLVTRPIPAALSREAPSRGLAFGGCDELKCVHAPWLIATPDGYRQLSGRPLPGDLAGAHRKVFELLIGSLRPLDIVRHSCGDKTCVNPHHLYIAGRQSPDLGNQYDRRKDRPVRGPYKPGAGA